MPYPVEITGGRNFGEGQALTGRFWNGAIQNYWNEITQTATLRHELNTAQSARLFALLNLTLADGVIAFYDAKYHYQLWRPVTAIRLANTSGNPAIVGDQTWTPLSPTALDPAYPSAHGVISGDGATVLSAFFGNQDQVRVTSNVLQGVVRTFASYNDVATEAGLSRIYAGQHTRIDNEAGLALGHAVAQFVLPHFSGK